MASIDHVTVRTSDVDASLALFSRCLEPLEFEGERFDDDGFHEWNDFSAQIEGWWRALIDAGCRDDGAPGPRPEYSPGYFGAFIRDRDSNIIEAVLHNR